VTRELDPEVLADLAYRARSEGDSTRSRSARYDWAPPPIVEHWPCAGQGCKATVGVTREAIDAHERLSAIAQRDTGRPIPRTQVCPACWPRWQAATSARARQRSEDEAAALRELRTLTGPEQWIRGQERRLRARLEQLGHPDVIRALREARAARDEANKPGKSRGKSVTL
jgi:hypothetical protein